MHTIIIGLDAFDPLFFERLHEAGKTPNLDRFVDGGGYRQFSVSNPAQSEVSWTSIATGLNPGGHGLFDFVHRNPETYALHVSLLPTKQSAVGTQFVPPYNARTLFDQAVEDGYPAKVLWWPATFPARFGSPVQTIPGLGVPDALGRIGVGTYFAPDPGSEDGAMKTPVEKLVKTGRMAFTGHLSGPARRKGAGAQETSLDFTLDIQEDDTALLTIGKQRIALQPGSWSPILELTFNMGLFVKLQTITRVILTQSGSDPRLYFLPLQIHPLNTPWRYASPPAFAKKTWNDSGPFLTLGWPQDTTALEEGIITDEQFLALCDDIFSTRRRIFLHHLDHLKEGVLANVFDTLDRVQHMFWRDRPDVVEQWYLKFDALIGMAAEKLDNSPGKPRLLVVSDHGFNQFEHKVHLNRWLIDQGYLDAPGSDEGRNLGRVNWAKSRAYAIGLNSLYLNLSGREGQGTVAVDQEEDLIRQLRQDLLSWRGPNGKPVLDAVWTRKEALEGELSSWGPDLIMGYAPGYRASAETGLGGWEADAVVANQDHWGADHCIHPSAVPGVLFSNNSLAGVERPSYHDFPSLALGKAFETSGSGVPPKMDDEDQDAVEERLKGLGYL